MAEPFKVGDLVRAKEAIYEPADDHAPGGYVCGKGDLLIVRKVRESGKWPLSVSHEDVTDNSFACGLDEVVPDGAQASPAPNPCTFPNCKAGACCANPSNARPFGAQVRLKVEDAGDGWKRQTAIVDGVTGGHGETFPPADADGSAGR